MYSPFYHATRHRYLKLRVISQQTSSGGAVHDLVSARRHQFISRTCTTYHTYVFEQASRHGKHEKTQTIASLPPTSTACSARVNFQLESVKYRSPFAIMSSVLVKSKSLYRTAPFSSSDTPMNGSE